MTEQERQMTGLMRQMASSVVPVEEPGQAEARRARVVGHMGKVHCQVRKKQQRAARWRRAIVWVAAAAIPLTLAAGSLVAFRSADSQQRGGETATARMEAEGAGVQVVHGEQTTTARASLPTEIRAGDEVVTGDATNAVVTLPSGAKLVLAPYTRLGVDDRPPEREGSIHEQVTLQAGRVDVTVPKLGPKGTFAVRTRDARVVVHGTQFTVRIQSELPDEPRTQVAVQEGRVVVHHGSDATALEAGDGWTSPGPAGLGIGEGEDRARTADDAKDAAPAAVPAPPPSPRPGKSPASDTAKAAESTQPASSTLAQENELFASAARARQAGDDARAIALLDRLLTQYPNSPLASAARRERSRAADRMRGNRGAP